MGASEKHDAAYHDGSPTDTELLALYDTPQRKGPRGREHSMSRRYLVRADGAWVRDTLGRLIKFTAPGAHLWAARHKPQAYSVFLHGATPSPSINCAGCEHHPDAHFRNRDECLRGGCQCRSFSAHDGFDHCVGCQAAHQAKEAQK